MNYSLCDIPMSEQEPVVFMDITLQGELLGRIHIRLFREIFPSGVENFVKIIDGRTFKVQNKKYGRYGYTEEKRRTYQGCKFYSHLFNNYVVSGDIYNNDGSAAGTIYCDEPIPPLFGPYFYPHNSKGLVSLVPFKDEKTGQLFYDSTFMITLADANPSNNLTQLDIDQVVIGQVYDGLDVIDRMNELLVPFAGRKYPIFQIGCCGFYRPGRPMQRRPPISGCMSPLYDGGDGFHIVYRPPHKSPLNIQ
uniref:PPIase cyclophilin-type domain-containing protein n=1 Tax=viral metagenome TaxID=1070528 RepID=A0A6C0LS80_9ZZZZ